MTRLTRDEYGLQLAQAASARADCSRRQVGAVIVSEDGSVVATGYNGLAAERPGCASAGACPRGQMTYADQPADVAYEATGCRAIHAEVNAIIRAGRDRCLGATIYVTDVPCFHCSVVIEGAGIVRVVTPTTVDETQTFRASDDQLSLPIPGVGPASITVTTSGPLDRHLYDALVRQEARRAYERGRIIP